MTKTTTTTTTTTTIGTVSLRGGTYEVLLRYLDDAQGCGCCPQGQQQQQSPPLASTLAARLLTEELPRMRDELARLRRERDDARGALAGLERSLGLVPRA